VLIKCHECGGKVSTEAKACVHCGAPPRVIQMCHECGDVIPEGEDACKGCGAPVCGGLAKAETPDVPTTEPRDCPQPTPVVESRVSSDCNVTSKNIINDFFSCTGRISRKTFAIRFAILILPALLLYLLVAWFAFETRFLGPLTHTAWLLLFIPIYSKRLHDLNQPGEWLWLFAATIGLYSLSKEVAHEAVMKGTDIPGSTLVGLLLIVSFLGSQSLLLVMFFKRGKNDTNHYELPQVGVEENALGDSVKERIDQAAGSFSKKPLENDDEGDMALYCLAMGIALFIVLLIFLG
jgi:uncharacterized membrane protein YhaH (DUF805 family)